MFGFLHSIEPLYSVSGFIVGGLVGFTGVGGGSLMTPLLVLVFGIVPTTAVGTDLLYADHEVWRHARPWSQRHHRLAGNPTARVRQRAGEIVTLACLSWLGKSSGHGATGLITSLLGFALLLTAIVLLFRDSLLDLIARHTSGLSDGQTRLLTTLLGAFLGFLVSITSVGAGAIGMTVLLALYSRLPTVRLVGSDIAHAVPLTFVAGLATG